MTYTASPLVPKLGVRIRDDDATNGVPRFVFGVTNSNPYRAMTITGMELSAEILRGPITVGRIPFTLDEGPEPGERIGANQTRFWKRAAGPRLDRPQLPVPPPRHRPQGARLLENHRRL